jgi:hypothetical protein
LQIEGLDEKKYALAVAHQLWSYDTLSKNRIVDNVMDPRQNQTDRVAFSSEEDLNKIKLLKKAVKQKFCVSPENWGLVWRNARESINRSGKNYLKRNTANNVSADNETAN